jgi:penicillin G amidase
VALVRGAVWDNDNLVLSTRILKLINLSIAIIVVILVVAAYWTAWRPLPKTSGAITAPVSARVTVERDARGVPHITAASWEDAIFVQGFVTAQERMWQMDALRRVAAGEISELIGKGGLDIDRDARRLRMRRIADEHVKRLDQSERALLAAYTRGVNHYLEQNRGKYGIEFSLLRYDPRPWTIADSILAGMQMFLTLTSTWKDDLKKMSLLAVGDRAKIGFLFPPKLRTGPSPGSNAWAISGAHTASGRPILANDPHLEFTLPSTWYMVHLKAEGLNVSGVSLPGLPAVVIGHNDRVSWGMTNLHYDVQDLYRERLNPQNGQYVYRGRVEQARLETDTIAVKDDNPVSLRTWVTRNGPAFINEGNAYYSLRWVAAEEGSFAFPFLDVNRARNWDEFSNALKRFTGPAQNWVYADVDGNIGYRVAGRLPVRANHDGDVAMDGTTGEFEWKGYIPFEQLPATYNPPSGIIVTANENPFPSAYPYRVSGSFAAEYRTRQIRTLLQARQDWKPVDMLAVQKDVYSEFSHFLARQIIAAYDRRKPGPEMASAIDSLRNWDGQMDKESSGALVAELLFRELRRAVAERVAPKKGELYETQIGAPVLERLLRERPSGWFKDWDDLLVASFGAALEEGAKGQGSNVPGWRYGAWNQLLIPNPVAGRLPLVGRYFNIGPVWMSGSPTSVKQTTRRLGPSLRMVVDLSNPDNSLMNITIGQSGHYLSKHYSDQWPKYYVGESLPAEFEKVDVKTRLDITPEN